jgi:hypothetical protein
MCLKSGPPAAILGPLDILADIGIPAEKEVIQWGTVYVDAEEEALVKLPSASLLLPRLRIPRIVPSSGCPACVDLSK